MAAQTTAPLRQGCCGDENDGGTIGVGDIDGDIGGGSNGGRSERCLRAPAWQGTSACVACAPGQYGGVEDASCVDCPAGYYAPNASVAACAAWSGGGEVGSGEISGDYDQRGIKGGGGGEILCGGV